MSVSSKRYLRRRTPAQAPKGAVIGWNCARGAGCWFRRSKLIDSGGRAMKDKQLACCEYGRVVGCKTMVLPNAGHMAFADQTAIFVNAVDGFVNGKTN